MNVAPLRSIGLCLTVAAGAVFIAPGVAAADSTNVVSYAGLPSPLTGVPFQPDCTTNTNVAATYTHVTGPATAPLGTGSLRLAVSEDSAADIKQTFPASDAVPLSQLTTFYFHGNVANGATRALTRCRSTWRTPPAPAGTRCRRPCSRRPGCGR